MNNMKEMRNLDPISHSVRRSQAVLQYGVGAMIDFPSQVLMTAMPESWQKTEIIHDERLEKMLGVDHFVTPSDAGIAFVRFPRWYFCPKCRRFQTIEKWQEEYAQKAKKKGNTDDPYMLKNLCCSKDNQELVPARIVTVCEHGHIDDFPWVNWVHRKNRFGEKDVCAEPHLKFKTGTSATSGLEGVEIECETCGAKASLLGAFNTGSNNDGFENLERTSEFHTVFKCTGKHPWKNETEACDAFPRTMQRGASSVYFPRIISSLVIPPYSNYLTVKIEESEKYKEITAIIKFVTKDCVNEDDVVKKIKSVIEEYYDSLADEIHESAETVKNVLSRKLLTQKDEALFEDKELKYKAEEYKALTGRISSESFERDEFSREGTDISLYGIKGLKSLALIHKVKEVSALIGFSRIQPTHSLDDSDGVFVSIKKDKTDFYPATVSKGEGIFIEFNKEQLSSFFATEQYENRIEKLRRKYYESFLGRNNLRPVDSEFLFIHTMSHLLIKELSFSCGYPTASIRERIYYGEAEGEKMCGVLIYTTGGDAEGTLGGLVRQGYADCFPELLKRALESAEFCANDPVCSFSDGQGVEALNYAACHSCTLLPETSCELSNILLDRTVVVGNIDRSIKGFYSDDN